jgi:SsrA-binding protein
MIKTLVKNRKAYFEYTIIEKYVCGVVLVGSEVKSIKSGKSSIEEAYCYISDGEVFIKGMNVSPHKEGGPYYNHEVLRDRKLLLKKKEIIKIDEIIHQKGLTLIPLQIILSDRGFIKIEIAICKGKNLYDKRQNLKIKDLDRELKESI